MIKKFSLTETRSYDSAWRMKGRGAGREGGVCVLYNTSIGNTYVCLHRARPNVDNSCGRTATAVAKGDD